MALKLNPDPLPHHLATANLLIEGLSVMRFEPLADRTWEVAFLRDTKHEFTLTIEGDGYEQERPEKIDMRTARIDISATRPIAPDWEQFPGGFWFGNPSFSRLFLANHNEDFRWVADLSNPSDFPLHGSVRLRRNPGKGRTTLRVGNIIFYTKELTHYELGQSLLDDDVILPFGKTNGMVGGDIRCENGGEVIVKIDGRVYARLPHVPGKPYTITLSNHEPKSRIIAADRTVGEYKRGDFKLYYELLDVALQSDLLCPANIVKTRDCDCETVRVSNLSTADASPLSFLSQSEETPAEAEPAGTVERAGQADAPNPRRTKTARPGKARAKK